MKTFLLALHCLSAFLMNALTFSFQFLVHPTGIGDTTENNIINISKAISQNDEKVKVDLCQVESSGRIDQSDENIDFCDDDGVVWFNMIMILMIIEM